MSKDKISRDHSVSINTDDDIQLNPVEKISQDDELDVIRELDAILDIHDTSDCDSRTGPIDLDTDYNYDSFSDEHQISSSIDSKKTERISYNSPTKKSLEFRRGFINRRTIGCLADKNLIMKSMLRVLDTMHPLANNNCNAFEENQSEINSSIESSTNNHFLIENDRTNESVDVQTPLTEPSSLLPLDENNIESNCSYRVNMDDNYVFENLPDSVTAQQENTLNDQNNQINNQFRDLDLPNDEGHIYHIDSEASTTRFSHNTSVTSMECSSSESSEFSSTINPMADASLVLTDRNTNSLPSSGCNTNPEVDRDLIEQKHGFNAEWPHSFSRTLALTSCTVGLFNLCRFSVMTVNYGANFLLQFLLLSIVFGIPFFWLQMCLGARIRAGPVTMWRISPICSGIGIALIIIQYILAIYSSVAIVWVFVYACDTIRYQTSYRWLVSNYYSAQQNQTILDSTLTQSIPDYFNNIVLQRLKLLQLSSSGNLHISDRLTSGLLILWTTICLILCKGLKSYGKIVFAMVLLPIITLPIITGKLLSVINISRLQTTFSSAELSDFMVNPHTWIAAAQETFLTWCLLGPSVLSMSSRSSHMKNRNSKLHLRRDAFLVVILTLFALQLAALIGLCAKQIVNQAGYTYAPGSYETLESSRSVYALPTLRSSELISFPSKLVPHYSGFIGEIYRQPIPGKRTESGYQALRLINELLPAVLVIANQSLSWIWAATIFLMLFIFGVAQLCAMWKPISSALGSSTNAVILSCVTGLLLSTPMATEVGILILHYLDFLLGGAWFIPILWVAQVLGVFLICGRPYNGDDLVNDLSLNGSLSAFLALVWNVLLPIGLITLSVNDYKASASNQLYYLKYYSNFTLEIRRVGALIQISLLLLVPIVALIQIYRYLTKGPPDILDRIQMLYQPGSINNHGSRSNRASANRAQRITQQQLSMDNLSNDGGRNNLNDAPPKYTPPPSYTTATGARLAKLLQQSIRRSLRRVLRDPDRSRTILPNDCSDISDTYRSSSNQQTVTAMSNLNNTISESIENSTGTTIQLASSLQPSNNSSRVQKSKIKKQISIPTVMQRSMTIARTLDLNRQNQQSRRTRPFTAEDVVSILRSSTINRHRQSLTSHHLSDELVSNRSIDNLVANAEPPGLSQRPSLDLTNNIENDSTKLNITNHL